MLGGHRNGVMVVCYNVGILWMETVYISWKMRGLVALALRRAGKFQHPCTQGLEFNLPYIQIGGSTCTQANLLWL